MGFPRLASADILPVLPGGSVQAQIDLAQPGDTVAIFGGTYSEDITVSNAVRLAEVSGQDVYLAGNVTITGVTNAPPLEGFSVATAWAKRLTIHDTPGILLKDLVVGGSGGFFTGTSEVKMQGCEVSAIHADSERLELNDSTVLVDLEQNGSVVQIVSSSFGGGGITQNAGSLYLFDTGVDGNVVSQGGSDKLIIFRSDIKGTIFTGGGGQERDIFVGYSDIVRYLHLDASGGGNGADITLIGNTHTPRNEFVADNRGTAIKVESDHHIVVANNRISGFSTGLGRHTIWIKDATDGYIVNNYINSSSSGYAISSGSPDVQILNNICVNLPITAPFGTIMKGNFAPSVEGGVFFTEHSTTDAMYDWDTNALLPGSPAIDGGSTDARYRDRDGSRNDAGPTGGAWFDPDGWTTDNPVVFSFDLSPEQVLEGTATDIILSNGQAVNQP
jgi:hypothetical protein